MTTFLLVALALAFYNVGTIWAHEVDIFRSWQYAGENFQRVQSAHWRKLPYWVLTPAAISWAMSIALFWYRPVREPLWGVAGFFAAQSISMILTAMFWGRWQASLSRDPAGAGSPYLARILRTHWVRTALITGAAMILLVSSTHAF